MGTSRLRVAHVAGTFPPYRSGTGTAVWHQTAELARRGCHVTVLEKSVPGAEASTAAAGILGPQLEHDDDGPTLDLGLAGARATGDLVRVLRAELRHGGL